MCEADPGILPGLLVVLVALCGLAIWGVAVLVRRARPERRLVDGVVLGGLLIAVFAWPLVVVTNSILGAHC